MATNPVEATEEIPALFTPLTVRGMTLPNRVVMSPLCMYSATDGVVGDWHVVHLGSRAMGGAGLVIAEMSAVHPDGRISVKDSGIWDDKHTEPWKRVVDFVHTHTPAKIAMQLGHAGRKGSTPLPWNRGGPLPKEEQWDIIAPSAIPFSPDSQTPANFIGFRSRNRGGEKRHAEARVFSHLGGEVRQGAGVLLRQELGGRHDGGLMTSLRDCDRGQKGDDGLSAANVPFEQPAHGILASEISGDLLPGTQLRTRLADQAQRLARDRPIVDSGAHAHGVSVLGGRKRRRQLLEVRSGSTDSPGSLCRQRRRGNEHGDGTQSHRE